MPEELSPVARHAPEGSGHDNLHVAVFGTNILCLILVSAFTLARFIAKRAVSKYQAEDYLLVITWLLLLGFTVAFMISSNQGVGRHIWDVADDRLPTIMKTNYVIDVFYAPTTWVAKTALLFQMQRIFCPTRRGFVYVSCYVLGASITITYSIISVALIFQCSPVKKVWDSTVTDGHCLDEEAMSSSTGVINVVTDFLILFLPVWAIWRLKMPLKRKFIISAIFATGLIACACSLCRMVYSFRTTESPDFTFTIAKLGISAVCEVSSLVLCTCFPLMPRFVQVCKDCLRDNQTIFEHFLRLSPSNPTDRDKRTFIEDDCVFCDDNASCAVHEMSNNLSMSRLESDPRSGTGTMTSPRSERRDLEMTRLKDVKSHHHRKGSIVVHQSFLVERV